MAGLEMVKPPSWPKDGPAIPKSPKEEKKNGLKLLGGSGHLKGHPCAVVGALSTYFLSLKSQKRELCHPQCNLYFPQ